MSKSVFDEGKHLPTYLPNWLLEVFPRETKSAILPRLANISG